MTCSLLSASALCCSSKQVEARNASRTQWAGRGRLLTASRSWHNPWRACGGGSNGGQMLVKRGLNNGPAATDSRPRIGQTQLSKEEAKVKAWSGQWLRWWSHSGKSRGHAPDGGQALSPLPLLPSALPPRPFAHQPCAPIAGVKCDRPHQQVTRLVIAAPGGSRMTERVGGRFGGRTW